MCRLLTLQITSAPIRTRTRAGPSCDRVSGRIESGSDLGTSQRATMTAGDREVAAEGEIGVKIGTLTAEGKLT